MGLALSEAGNTWRMSHRMQFGEVMRNEATETLGIARDQLGELERNARILQKNNIKRDDPIRNLAVVFAPDAEVKELISDPTPRLQAILGAHENAPGAQPGNTWGVLNAVTYWADHMASRTADMRLTNAWLGKTSGQKEKTLEALLQLARAIAY